MKDCPGIARRWISAVLTLSTLAACTPSYDVIVIGGGASGVCAGLQAGRKGADVLLLCEFGWLGGMLTSAGVSAVDGNYNLRGGIFAEFTDSLASRYGGYENMKTGWVSNILFEPHVGAAVFDKMVSGQKKLQVERNAAFVGITEDKTGWTVSYRVVNSLRKAHCKVVVDATELGDAIRAAHIPYRLGMDARAQTGESGTCLCASDIIQDLTYVAILKDYGIGADATIERPDGYDPSKYANSCLSGLSSNVPEKGQALWSREQMIDYGKLPGGKYMLNWPIEGNDFYLNVVDSTEEARRKAYAAAKNHTLGFIHYIQTELGMKHLGLADDEFPTEDRLPMMPYNRESRRIKAKTLFTVNVAENPYGFKEPLYRTGIAVGDYAVDHHHFRHPDWRNLPKLLFAPIQAFSLPLGCLIPADRDNFIVAEKSVGVSNLMNGATRLQPVVMEIGQAAGELAAIAVKKDVPVQSVGIREVQRGLLESGCYLLPLRDVPVDSPQFKAIQRIAATGILHSTGFYADWQNKSYIRADDPLLWNELFLDELYGIAHNPSEQGVSVAALAALIRNISGKDVPQSADNRILTRGRAIVMLDKYLDPFNAFEVDYDGHIVSADKMGTPL